MNWLKRNKAPEVQSENPEAANPRGLKRWLRWPKINLDLALPTDRLKFFLFWAVLLLLAVGALTGGVLGYEYTESAEFCGTTCHSMDPQWVRYQASPHLNVRCADCHIGPGANFFVKSKIDGLRQVYAETMGTYARPIKSPIHNLRPARDTCEGCHSPTTFKDNIVKTNLHFDNDQANTPILNTLILKMGGWSASTGQGKGIHWHTTGKVYYIAADEERQVMLWVGVEQPDGSLKEFFARDLLGMQPAGFVEKARQEGKLREMDCIDCHNRTAHDIPAPQKMVDQAIEEGLISRDLPYIRANAVAVLNASYPDQAAAFAAIDNLANQYQANSGGKVAAGTQTEAQVQQALQVLKKIYTETNFPEMRLKWDVNANNERHTPFLGCFRCHDGNHFTSGANGEPETISVKCNLCHTVPIIGRGDERLVEAPVVAGPAPASHVDFRWTIEHRSVTPAQTQECYQCHGQGFCNNGACHNLSHPENMAFVHPEQVRKVGQAVCYNCHQNVTCTRCHPAGIINLP
jgi:nitrate/TMAO reductase-like tetraheme cytochrome c subunit